MAKCWECGEKFDREEAAEMEDRGMTTCPNCGADL